LGFTNARGRKKCYNNGVRKIIILSFISLDGVLQAPGGPKEDTSGKFKFGGWTFPYMDESSGKMMGKQMALPFDLLLGRKTFEIFASYWPEHESIWPGINKVKKYVASKKLKKHAWTNSIFLQGDVVAEIKKLKRQKGPNLHVYGSGNFIQTLLKNDLVDELWLKIFPLILGPGKRLFAEGAVPRSFTLTDSKTTPSGVIFANYKRSGGIKTGSLV
jgi:dihydrofolate reductase